MPSITTLIPIITGIWDSILRAVPKKKTTHSQKRKRQLIGKALEDKKNITRCEACGDLKLLHTLCGSCVKAIQKDWRDRERMGL
jgi:large subunit ribosomal protein L32